MIKLFNTLSGKKEEFKPIKKGSVSMYHCGPTVYDYAHIGNLRSYVFADLLRRTLEAHDYEIKQVINITDVGHLSGDVDTGEDKMTKALKREGKPLTLEAMLSLANFYAGKFKEDLTAMNIKIPNEMPKASEHIADDIEIIERLEKKGFMYTTSDGIYFDTTKYPDYGKLGNRQKEETAGETRIGTNNEKKSVRDFALWKFNRELGWDTPWGKGFPGWHIECSAMARKYLGQPFDIHTGGIDHISIHHNNEIAQSECAYDTPLANIWMHNEFITVASGKMAKSEGNFLTLKSIKEKGFEPMVYRYWLLTGHYRSPLAFSLETLEAARNAHRGLIAKLSSWLDNGMAHADYYKRFLAFVSDDLDTPRALALIWEITKDLNMSEADRRATILKCDAALGLSLETEIKKHQEKLKAVPERVRELLRDRDLARAEKKWKEADLIRNKIQELGFLVKDGPDGSYLDLV